MRTTIRTRLFLLITLSVVFVIAIGMVILLFNFKAILLSRANEDQKSFIMKGASDLENVIHELDRVTLYLCGDQLIPQLLESPLDREVDAKNFTNKLQSSISVYTNYPITGSSIDYYSILFVAEHFPAAKYLNSYQLGKYLKSKSRVTTTASNSILVKDKDWYKKTLDYNTRVYSFLLDHSQEFIFFSKLVRNINFKKPFHDDVMGVLVFVIKKTDIIKILDSAKPTESAELILVYDDIILTGTKEGENLSGKTIPERFFQANLFVCVNLKVPHYFS